jgi:hypothetical protein
VGKVEVAFWARHNSGNQYPEGIKSFSPLLPRKHSGLRRVLVENDSTLTGLDDFV